MISRAQTLPPFIRQILLIVFFALLASGCSKTSDEEQIAETIAAMQDAVENKSFARIRVHLHDSFIANDRMSARDVKHLLQIYSMQHREIGATILSSKTTMDATYADRAESVLSVIVTGSSGGLPSDGSARTVRLEWIKESGDWLVRKADWQY